MIIVLYIILAIVLLLFMVLVHEFGHYCAGRALGFKIEEFSVGFGKALISKTNKRGEKISLRLFPLGGYCAFAGEDDESAGEDSFVKQAPWKRIIVFLAGVTFNFLTAIVFSVILLCAVGYDIPQVIEYNAYNTAIEYKADNKTYYYKIDDQAMSKSYIANWDSLLKQDDVIFAVDGLKIDFAYTASFPEILKSYADALSKWDDVEGNNLDNFGANGDGSITLTVRREGEYIEIKVPLCYSKLYTDKECTTAATNDNGQIYIISLGAKCSAYKHSFWEALSRCVSFSFGLAWVVLKSLAMLITFQVPISQIGGPITTISTIASFTQQDLSTTLILIPLLSANLAVFNALPFPALDGSHVFFTTIEWIRKKPLNRKVENIIHTAGLAILFGFVIIVDILHFVL